MLNGLLSRQVPEMGVERAHALEAAVFLDARELEEYQVSHIPGALWVGYEDFRMDRLKGISKESTIVVYCSVGYRSERITKRLTKEGYRAAYNLYGGIFEWVNRDYPIRNEQGSTPKVHAYDRFWGIWLTSGEKVY
jgi:rhodanese-related sulfurtransferase